MLATPAARLDRADGALDSLGRGSVRTAVALIGYCAVLAAGVWRDAATLLRYPLAVGIDGYYYVQQASTYLNSGHFYYPTSTPAVLYLITGASYLLGDPIVAVKIVAVALHALLCLGVFAVLVRVGCPLWLSGLGGAMAAASGAHLYMVVEFINNLGAITLLVWCGWCLLKDTGSKRLAWSAALFLFLLAAASHKSAIAVVAILALLWFVSARLLASETRGRYLYGLLGVIVAAWVVPAAAAWMGFVALPGREEAELLSRPRLPFTGGAAVEKWILLIAALALCWAFVRLSRHTRQTRACRLFCTLALLGLVVNLNPFLSHYTGLSNIVGRFDALAYIQAAFLVPGVIWTCSLIKQSAAWLVAAGVAPFVVLSMFVTPPAGLHPALLAGRAQLIKGLEANRQQYLQQLGPSPLVVSGHGNQFIVTALLGVPSESRLPAEKQKYQNIHWLLSLDPGAHPPSMIPVGESSDRAFVLMNSDSLKQHLESLSDDERQRLFALNPHLVAECVKSGFGRVGGSCVRPR